MVLVIVWVLAVTALLALTIAWGAATDSYVRSRRSSRDAPPHVASPASR